MKGAYFIRSYFYNYFTKSSEENWIVEKGIKFGNVYIYIYFKIREIKRYTKKRKKDYMFSFLLSEKSKLILNFSI